MDGLFATRAQMLPTVAGLEPAEAGAPQSKILARLDRLHIRLWIRVYTIALFFITR
jgi:hypothetical protein